MRWRLSTAGIVVVVVAVVAVILAARDGGSRADPRSHAGSKQSRASDPPDPSALVSVPRSAVRVKLGAGGQTIPNGYLGLSMEFQAVRSYTGSDPTAINPLLVALIRNLSPGQAPVLRIGGDSTDASYAPGAGVSPPPYVAYALTPGWMATTAALARETGARMIMGLNLAANQPALAAAEARDFVRAFGRPSIEAMEIGNEPNLYNALKLLRSPAGEPLAPRAHDFAYPSYQRQFQATGSALRVSGPPLSLAGPALAAGPTAGPGSWVRTMSDFLARDRSVRIMTVHRYPLRNCFVSPGSTQYPTIANLLSPYSTVDLAAGVAPWVRIAHAHGRRLRIDELNSVACRGRKGVSDTFASSLWATDALFSLAAAGVDGVNLHTLPDSAYELFQFSRADGRWRSWVRPVYYGLQLFAQAAPVGSRLVSVTGVGHTSRLSAWATVAPDRSVRMVLIDKDPSHRETVVVPAPAGSHGPVTIERLSAPSVSATGHITLGGRSYGRETYRGVLRPPIAQSAAHLRNGDYVVTLPGTSAALVTFAAR